ncbi:MAG TPA: hypothetical protein VFS58_12725 [Steroidobacteraceae bacterium]|nr:hypothetical protein [Steroidobacteraceae bacterium]
MKAKNQTGQNLLELATTAANEDGISPATRENAAPARKQAWSPLEVWRTRVKTPAPATSRSRTETAQIQG